MSFRLPDLAEFGLTVSGQDMMVGAGPLMDVSLIENAKSTSPSMTLTFLDNKQAAGSFGIFQDGVPIVVTIGDGTQDPVSYTYRQWALKDATSNSGGDLATLHGVADLVPWHSKVITKAYKGNASDVATQLAQEGGIQNVDVDSTSDSMTWLPDGRAIAQFVRNMMDHAWMGASGCPHMAVTSDSSGQWTMRVKDILQQGGAAATFSSAGINQPGDLIVWDFRIASSGGALNTQYNYGHKVVQEMQSGTPDVWKDFNVTKLTSFLGINAALQGTVSLAKTFYHPPDQGNAHPNYAQALHNNKMARATFSTTVTILTKQMSQVKLMDDVQINLARSTGDPDTAYSGLYKVTALTRHISGGAYHEKIVAASQGIAVDAAGAGL